MTRRMIQHSMAVVAIGALAGAAYAAGPDSNDNTLLKGPEVVASDAPGAGLSMDGTRGNAVRAGDTPLRAYMHAVRSLSGPDADPGVALSDAQQEQIREAAQVYARELKDYLREHREELREIRELGAGDALRRLSDRSEMPQRRVRDGATPDAERAERAPREPRIRRHGGPDRAPQDADAPRQREGKARLDDIPPGPDPESRRLGMEKLRALMQEAPSDQAAKAAIWETLSEDQQAFVQAKIDELAAAREDRIAERMESQATRKKDKGAKRPSRDD